MIGLLAVVLRPDEAEAEVADGMTVVEWRSPVDEISGSAICSPRQTEGRGEVRLARQFLATLPRQGRRR